MPWVEKPFSQSNMRPLEITISALLGIYLAR
jgi:hypothetical protein